MCKEHAIVFMSSSWKHKVKNLSKFSCQFELISFPDRNEYLLHWFVMKYQALVGSWCVTVAELEVQSRGSNPLHETHLAGLTYRSGDNMSHSKASITFGLK